MTALAFASVMALVFASAAQAPPSTYGPGPCDGKWQGAAWCDCTLPFRERAAAIVANLTIKEKAGLFVNEAEPVPRLELPAYNWWSEALHGVARDGLATAYPQICGVAASLNRSLFFAIGEATGVEVTASLDLTRVALI